MNDVSFVNPRLASTMARQRSFAEKRSVAESKPVMPSPLPGEVADALAEEIARQDKLARKSTGNPDAARAYNGDASVKHTVLTWHSSSELVVIVKTSAKESRQLHFPIVGGWFVYEDGPGVLGWSSSETIEGLQDFLVILRRDVARILRASKPCLN